MLAYRREEKLGVVALELHRLFDVLCAHSKRTDGENPTSPCDEVRRLWWTASLGSGGGWGMLHWVNYTMCHNRQQPTGGHQKVPENCHVKGITFPRPFGRLMADDCMGKKCVRPPFSRTILLLRLPEYRAGANGGEGNERAPFNGAREYERGMDS